MSTVTTKELKKEAQAKKDPDLDTWLEWKATGDVRKVEELMTGLKPVILSSTRKWQGNVPPSAINARAFVLARKALDSYDPDRGVKLSTHVVTQVQPISRLVYQHQNFAKIPENRLRLAGAYRDARLKLKDELNREPSDREMADELKVSMKQTSLLRRELWRDVIDTGMSNQFHGFQQVNRKAEMLNFLYHELAPRERLVFEKLTGYNNHTTLKNSREIASATGIPLVEVEQIRRKLTQRIKEFSP